MAPGDHRRPGPFPGHRRRCRCAARSDRDRARRVVFTPGPIPEGLPDPGEGRTSGGHGSEVRPGRPGRRVGRRMDDELGAEPGIVLRPGGGNRRHRAQLPTRPGSGSCRSIPAWTWGTRNATCNRCPRSSASASTPIRVSRSPCPTSPAPKTSGWTASGRSPSSGSASGRRTSPALTRHP